MHSWLRGPSTMSLHLLSPSTALIPHSSPLLHCLGSAVVINENTGTASSVCLSGKCCYRLSGIQFFASLVRCYPDPSWIREPPDFPNRRVTATLSHLIKNPEGQEACLHWNLSSQAKLKVHFLAINYSGRLQIRARFSKQIWEVVF